MLRCKVFSIGIHLNWCHSISMVSKECGTGTGTWNQQKKKVKQKLKNHLIIFVRLFHCDL